MELRCTLRHHYIKSLVNTPSDSKALLTLLAKDQLRPFLRKLEVMVSISPYLGQCTSSALHALTPGREVQYKHMASLPLTSIQVSYCLL